MTDEKKRRGFAGMDEQKQKRIASMGGTAAHERGRAHEFTSEEAKLAGQKGGRAVSQDREHMVTIGRKGGLARGQRYRLARQALAAKSGAEAHA